MEKTRCTWCLGFEEYIDYHDKEWGVPVYEDHVHFEFLILEGAQAGLSWATVLKKRKSYRELFNDFNPKEVARFTDKRIEKILKNPGIIRNKLKVESAVHNAKLFLQVQKEFGNFNEYIWSFTHGKPVINSWKQSSEIPASSPLSDTLSKDLKKRGFKFVGTTIMYAHLQACGLVNDHLVSCFRYRECKALARKKG